MSNTLIDTRKALEVFVDMADADGIDISTLPVDVLAGCLIYAHAPMRSYTQPEIVQSLLALSMPGPIKWGPITESGYTRGVMVEMSEGG